MNKVVAELVVYDALGGKAEILDMDYRDGKLETLKVRWIVASLCYSESYLPEDEIKRIYYGEDTVNADQIYHLGNFEAMTSEKIDLLRATDYMYQCERTKKAISA